MATKWWVYMDTCGDVHGLINYPIPRQSATPGYDAERSRDSRTREAQCLSEARPRPPQV